MPTITRTDIIDFRRDAAERRAAAQEITVQLVAELFEGPGLAPLCGALQRGDINIFRLALFYDGDAPVGFAMVVHDRVEHEGRTCVVGRAFTGMRRAYRGRGSSLRFFVASGIGLLRHHRGEELWGFVPALHISSYRVIARHFPGAVPHPSRPVSEAQRGLIEALARRFGCERRPGDHPLVCRRHLRVKDARCAPPTPRAADELDRFFHAMNPGHAEGACVMVLVPVTPGTLLGAAGRALLSGARRLLRPLQGRALGAAIPGRSG